MNDYSQKIMSISKLMIYELRKEPGEVPFVVLKATGKPVRLENLTLGDLLDIDGKKEVIVSAATHPFYIDTFRRNRDGRGIDIVRRWQGNLEPAVPCHTIPHFGEYWDVLLTKGRGYGRLNTILKHFGK